MPDTRFDINSLRVASPCPASWDDMTGDERTRACGLCKLNVYNLSAMTANEVETLITGSKGRLCIRLYRRADGTVITQDCPVGIRALQKRVTRIAVAAFASVLGLFSIGFGQKDDKKDEKTIDASKLDVVKTVIQAQTGEVTGTIVDENGAVIPGAKITLLRDSKTPLTSTSNEEGNFEIVGIEPGLVEIQVRRPLFKRLAIQNLKIESGVRLKLDLTLNVGAAMGELIGITAGGEELIDTGSATIQTTFTPRQIEKIPH